MKVKPKAPRAIPYSKALEQLGFKTLQNITSIKFYILVISTIFFYIGKLSEGTWQETVLAIAGLRAVNEVASMFKKPQVEAPAESGEDA